MNNKTAVTSKSEYQTRACQICGTEVALGDVPKDSVDDPGHIVVISSGELTIEKEKRGNWDIKSEFFLTREDSENPNISANVICESCGREVHNVSNNTETLLSDIPDYLKANENSPQDSTGRVMTALILGIILLFIIIIII